jgi:hypothetical protein
MIGTFPAFCAPATSGHATTPPSPAMNSRRRISALQRFVGKPIAAGVPRERVALGFAALHESGNGPNQPRCLSVGMSASGGIADAGLRPH